MKKYHNAFLEVERKHVSESAVQNSNLLFNSNSSKIRIDLNKAKKEAEDKDREILRL